MNKNLILALARQDLVDRYSGSVLGALWATLLPLSFILIYILIFSQIMQAKLGGFEGDRYAYSVYLIGGILVWNAFSATMLRTATLFEEKRGLIKKVSLSLPHLPIAVVVGSSITFVISLAIFIVFLVLIGRPLSWSLLIIFPVFLTTQILAYGLGLLTAVFIPFFKDLKEFFPILVQIWFWFTPIVYPVSILSENLQNWLVLNPVAIPVSMVQNALLSGTCSSIWPLVYTAAGASFVVASALWLLHKLEKDIRDLL